MRDARAIVERARASDETAIVVTHGTDTMVQTARALADGALAGKTIVLTGAMVPYAFGSSDGLFNLGQRAVVRAGAAARRLRRDERPALSAGTRVRKNTRDRRASNGERHERRRAAAIEAAVGRHDDLHRDVAAGRGARRDQPVAGISGLRLRSGARRGGRAAHARRAQPVRADAGRARAARGDRREVRRTSTAAATIRKPKSRSRPAAPRRSSTRSPRCCIRATKRSSSSRATTRTCRRSS